MNLFYINFPQIKKLWNLFVFFQIINSAEKQNSVYWKPIFSIFQDIWVTALCVWQKNLPWGFWFILIYFSNHIFQIIPWQPSYTSESQVWISRGGNRPQNRPRCGYSGTNCPLTFEEQYLAIIISAIVIAVLAVIIAILLIYFVIRYYSKSLESYSHSDRTILQAYNMPLIRKITHRSKISIVTAIVKRQKLLNELMN